MDEDQIKYRHCSATGCTYKEVRGSWMGAFVNGKFVCDPCYRASQTKEWEAILDRRSSTFGHGQTPSR